MLLAPTVAKVWKGIDCYAMNSNALATYPFHGIGMQTIGMDTYGFVAGVVVDAALNVLTQQDRMLTVVQSVWGPMLSPSWAGKRRSNRPFAHAGSPRDNPLYRAAFACRNRPLSHRSGDRL